MLLTIIGGAIFVGSQAWEWSNFIRGEYGAVETKGGQIFQFQNSETGKRIALHDFAIEIPSERVQHESKNGVWYVGESTLPTYTTQEVIKGFVANDDLVIKTEKID